MPLEQIVARIEAGPGRELWNGASENPEVVLVTRPASRYPVPALECEELRPALLARMEGDLRRQRRRNGLVFYPLAAVSVWAHLGLHTFALLPAVFALLAGAAHVEAWLKLRALRNDPRRFAEHEAARLRYGLWMQLSGGSHRCRSCWAVGAWAVIGGLQAFLEGSTASALLDKQRVWSEPWRLLTAVMLHGSIFHFVMNASAMLALGPMLERGVHRHLALPVWLAGALAGSLLSWAATPQASLGASGGILALFSFLAVMGWRRRSHLPPDYTSSIVRGLAIIAILGVFAWGVIDNAAHLGGAIAGAALGAWVFRDRQGDLPLDDTPALAIAGRTAEAAFVAVALWTAIRLVGPP